MLLLIDASCLVCGYWLVFHRKDLCERRPQLEVCSNFQMSFLHLSTPEWRHLVAKSSTTWGQPDIWWAFGSDWPSIRCTPPLYRHLVKVVLHEVSLTFCQPWVRLTFSQMYLWVEAPSGQEQYYMRSAWHLVSLWDRLTFSQTYPQERHLVNKSGTTSGQLYIWSAFGSGWPSVRCTPQ